MQRLVFVVMLDGVVTEYQTVYRLGIQDGGIECIEFILFDDDTAFLATVEKKFLPLQVRYLGIDGNDGIGELELVGKSVDETVLADENVAASTGFVPAVTVAA